uniref:Putative methyltransferase n=1 Tax=viral metagenome TaxID=1070528 RepID=A0A6H1ZNC3_9ZZZZ
MVIVNREMSYRIMDNIIKINPRICDARNTEHLCTKEHVAKMEKYYLMKSQVVGFTETPCPEWRVRDVFKYMKDNNKIFAIGTSIGNDIRFFNNASGIDCVLGLIKIGTRLGRNLIYGLSESIPIKSNSINIVIAIESFEHVFNLNKCLSEIKRILKHDGLLYFTVPDINEWKEKVEVDVRGYSYEEWISKINGFKLVESGKQYNEKYCYYVFRKRME